MNTITFVNESKSLNQADANAIASALGIFVGQVCTAWGLGDTAVAISNTRSTNGWNVCIVDKFPNPVVNAYGYHEVINGQPIAYIRADSFATAPLGKFRKGISIRGKVISQDRYQQGTAAVVFHEVVEMLVDPNITHVSAPDKQGRTWLMEPADHVRGGLYKITARDGRDVIAPDWTLPSYYDVNGKAPYSYLNAVTTPFTLTPTGYGFYKDATGALHKL
jgi:hypothetical protein